MFVIAMVIVQLMGIVDVAEYCKCYVVEVVGILIQWNDVLRKIFYHSLNSSSSICATAR